MKRFLFSNSVHTTAGSIGLLVARVGFGLSMAWGHGWPKIRDWSEISSAFPDPLKIASIPGMEAIASPMSLGLAIFAELICGVLLAWGLLGRLVALPLAFTMGVAVWVVHAGEPIFAAPGEANSELAFIYLIAYVALLITGPGRFSIDDLLNR